MVKLSLVLFVASAHGLHLAPALRSPLMTSRVPTPMLIDAPSDFSIDFIMDKVASFFASGDKKPVRDFLKSQTPTHASVRALKCTSLLTTFTIPAGCVHP